jgi:hypothetical protein
MIDGGEVLDCCRYANTFHSVDSECLVEEIEYRIYYYGYFECAVAMLSYMRIFYGNNCMDMIFQGFGILDN